MSTEESEPLTREELTTLATIISGWRRKSSLLPRLLATLNERDKELAELRGLLDVAANYIENATNIIASSVDADEDDEDDAREMVIRCRAATALCGACGQQMTKCYLGGRCAVRG